MTASDADLKDALRAYVRAACAALKASGWSLPPADDRGDGWVHLGDDSFVLQSLHRSERLLPTVYGPQHAGPEHSACVEALKAHPVIGPRLGHLVGSELGASLLDPEGIPDRCLSATLRAGIDVAFDEPAFDRAAGALIDWLTRSGAFHTTVAPLPSIDIDSPPIILAPGIEIDVMTDDEVADCLTVGVLGGGTGMMGHTFVRPRTAVRIREELPLRVGRDAEIQIRNDYFVRWREMAEQVVFALRLLKPGNVWSPGLMTRGDWILDMRGGSFTPSATSRYLPTPGFRLSANDARSLVALWLEMNNDAVTRSRPLTTAIRRFGLAGERIRPEDQIIDLMIAAEALFLPGDMGESGHKLSMRAGFLLGADVKAARRVAVEMRRAYDARSRLAHGVAADTLRMKHPDRRPATLSEYVAIAEGHVRDALRLTVACRAETGRSPMDDWDKFVFGRLGGSEDAAAD